MKVRLKFQVTTIVHLDYETSIDVKPVLRATDVDVKFYFETFAK